MKPRPRGQDSRACFTCSITCTGMCSRCWRWLNTKRRRRGATSADDAAEGREARPGRRATPRTPEVGMKPALVTGATGFLGWHVVQVLNQRGVPVRALVRRPEAARALDAELVVGDLRDAESVERA